jgi:hypothetical protein
MQVVLLLFIRFLSFSLSWLIHIRISRRKQWSAFITRAISILRGYVERGDWVPQGESVVEHLFLISIVVPSCWNNISAIKIFT